MRDEVAERMMRGMGEASLNTTQLQQEVAGDDWASIVESIGDGFWVFDRSWCCTYINNRQASLVGMPKENVRGKNVWELFPDLVDTEFYRQLHRAVTEQTSVHFEYFSPMWQGWFEIRVYPSARGVSMLMFAITERKQTQELLRETEQRFQAFMNHSPVSAWIADKQGQILYLNPTYFRMFQFQNQDAVGKNILDIYPAEFAQKFLENNQRVFATGQVLEMIETAPLLDGNVGEFLVYKFPVKNGAGETLLGGIAVDITERRRVEQALRASEQHLKIALQTAKLGSWQVDLTTNTLTCSEQCKANFGLPPEAEFSHQTLFAALHPEDCDRVQAAIQRSVEERSDYEIEERCFWPDGSLHRLIARGRLIDDANGIPIRMVGVTLDITECKQAEEELRLSEERFRLATRAVAGLVYDWDVQTGTVYRSEGLYQLVGVHPEEVPETRNWWIERIHPDDRAGIQSVMNVIVAGNADCYDYEYRVRHQDGRWIDVWDRGYIIRDGNGQLIRVVGSSTDISGRKQAEEARRRQEEELRLVTDSVPALIAYIDSGCRYRFVNRAFSRWFGQPAEQIIGRTIEEFAGETVYQSVRQDVEEALAGQPVTAELWMPFRDDGSRYVRRQYIPDIGDSGEVKGFYALINDITDLKQAEEALRKSETVLNAFLASSPIGLALFDRDLRYLYANEALATINGLPLNEHLGRTLWDVLPQIATEFAPRLQQIMQTQEPVLNLEFSGEIKPGLYRDCLANHFPVCLPDGEVLGVGITVMDISELKRIEAALRESEALTKARAEELEIFMEMVPAAVWIAHDPQCHYMSANRTAYELMRRTSDSVMTATPPDGEYPFEFTIQRNGQDIPPDELPMQQAGRTGQNAEGEFEFVFDESDVRFIYGRAVPLWDESGRVRGVIGAFLDLSERKRVEEALRESNERLNLALAAADMGDWSWDAATDIVTFSEPAAVIFGIPPGPYMTWTQMRELLHEQDRDRARLEVERAILEHSDYDIEYRVMRPDGVSCWVTAKGRAQYDSSGQVLGMIGVVQDITERKRAEQALQESEAIARARAQELEALMEITPIGLWIAHDPNCHYMSANQTAYDLMRAEPGSVATSTPPDGSYPLQFQQRRNGQEVAPHDLPMQRAARTGQEVIDELEFVFQDGTVRFIYGKAIPLRNETGKIRGVIGAFVDVTERKHAEQEREQLLARERAAREQAEAANRIKDEFLAVLSHELRSPLNPILGWTKLLRTRKFDEQATNRALETIERNATLQTQLIEDLLDVSRILQGKMALNVSPLNLVTTIEAALETVRLAAEAKGIQIQTDLAPNVGLVSGDVARLQQVVWNLVSNAVKFTPRGGQVEVRLEKVREPLKNHSLSIEPSSPVQPSTQYAQILVSDTGKGIKPEFLPYVFDYFRQADSSTTRTFGGLGLGLAIVRHLVELHGGLVCAESPGEGLGATFRIRLPLMEAAQAKPEDVPFEHSADLSGLLILVVDDEADLRELVTFILEEFGAKVTVTASAQEALAALQQAIPDVLLSDIGMPGVDGYMLMRQIRALPPEQGGQVKAIALTAYAGEYNQQQALEAGFQLHLAKPVEPEKLVNAIARLVGRTD